MRPLRISSSLLFVVVLALAFAGVGCPCVRSAVNASPSLRWWLFSNFGASRICPEALKRGVPLKLGSLAGTASIGRFFPQQCQVRVDDPSQSIVMTATGTGYAVLPLARRIGFYAGVSVEYRPDFRLEEDATYVWGRYSRLVAPPDLRLLGVENAMVNLATKTPLGDVATVIGQGILTSELGRGFTVVRQDDGDDFTLGILQPPEKPKRQFQSGSDRVVVASDVTEVHASSRDYLGPFEVKDGGAALYFKYRVTGAPVVYAVMAKLAGDAWRAPYETAQPIGPPPVQPITSGTLVPGEGILPIPLAAGSYYFVVENRAAPPATPFGMPIPLPEALAYVSYSIEIGDRP